MGALNIWMLACILSFAEIDAAPSSSVAILHLRSYSKFARICATFSSNPSQSTLPKTLVQAEEFPIVIIPQTEGCDIRTPPRNATPTRHAMFFWTGGNCSFMDRLEQAENWGAKQVIFIIQHDHSIPDARHHGNISFPVGSVTVATWKTVLHRIGDPKFSNIYQPTRPLFDPNLILLWLIAVATVFIGGYSSVSWPENSDTDNDSDEGIQLEDSEDGDEGDGYGFPPISPLFIIVFIVMLCLVLLLLYYFYRYVIYFVIAVFALASVRGSYVCLGAIFSVLSPCVPDCRIPERFLKSQPRISSIIILLFSIGLSIFWFVFRNNHYAWVLQDILAVFLCITILHEYHLPNMKVSSILLLALLFYDIFFVFITPMITHKGTSVMIQVATGGGNKETIPMVIKLPKFIHSAMMLCERPYSLVGLGDILVPGLFVSFCHNFDATARLNRRVYFTTSCVAYGLGLFLAFLMLVVTRSGQPALLYLCPCVLASVTVVGMYRRELKELWQGVVYKKQHPVDDMGMDECMEDEEEEEEKELLKREKGKEDQVMDGVDKGFYLAAEGEKTTE